ncbi:DHHC palmitoyltransferase-domain-containing protein [Mycena sanguinolenta]|nr:DHHC palmitoyltransferase-domain-containing protein [Mycena sanguinolenta]
MARKPLRSKYCWICDKCIARSDRHCPWVWNCVGANNHRQFVIFVTTLVFGVGLFDYLTYAYFSNIPIPVPVPEPGSTSPPFHLILLVPADGLALRRDGTRPVPRERCGVGDVAAVVDVRAACESAVADCAADDDAGGVEFGAVWVYGRPRRRFAQRANGHRHTHGHGAGAQRGSGGRRRARPARLGHAGAHAHQQWLPHEPPYVQLSVSSISHSKYQRRHDDLPSQLGSQ